MAQTKKSMGAYARRNDAEGAPLPASKSMEDLKVQVPGDKRKSASNTHALRTTRSTAEKQPKLENDTNFSEIDRTSTVGSTKRTRSHGAPVQAPMGGAAPQHYYDEEMTERPEYEAGNDVPEPKHEQDQSSDQSDVPRDPLKQLQEHNSNPQGGHERAPAHSGHNPYLQQQIQGDSYPPTTSGNPSVTDQPEGLPPYSTHLPENKPRTVNSGLPARGAGGTRLPTNTSARPQQNHNGQANPAARNSAMSYGMPGFNNVVADVNANFSFAKAGGPRGTAPAQQLQHGGPPQMHPAPTNVAMRGSPPVTHLSSHQGHRQPRPGPTNAQSVVASPQEVPRAMKRPPATQQQSMPPGEQASMQHGRTCPAQRHEPTSRAVEHDNGPMVDNRRQYNLPESSFVQEEATGEEPDGEQDDEVDDEPDILDYEEDEIYAMNFSALKAESFDVDPQADELQLPSVQQQATFQDKLQAVSVLPARSQGDFYKSLPVEQWEEAGDWFLDQFGEVLKKFKAARQDKRKAAMAFEDEIEKRHEAVSRKRKITEDALGEMRKTGSVVLQGTPKSKRTK
ncbi:uncharacterized protein CLAFUR5_08049 [Fulvia fulva]|uniref:Extracellular mutant protein 11 C-terminal domain-containing protein n=1 Tax=Passalora fulva TaxID=5499 RepID=A0A9Q8P617_PASFU|nr:uncharacterized protein CLAFUR5_08049 [Fulvia fulva]KAK4629791.1 hypothetical protein CLAFUR0_07927 [Fulvia fulva]UJO14685.1 hypothetical protein CLAFUR5_08049 [Fulvia fulva]